MLSPVTADNRNREVYHVKEIVRRIRTPVHAWTLSFASHSPLVTRHCPWSVYRRALVGRPGSFSLLQILPNSRSPLLVNSIFSNHFSFHQHRGEASITHLCFNNIVERRKADIFSTCLFNNLGKINRIFHPLFFLTPRALKIV